MFKRLAKFGTATFNMGSASLKTFNQIKKPLYYGHLVRPFSADHDIESKFQEAVSNSTKLKEEPSNESKLRLYALFKQATQGQCNAPKPGMFDLVAKYKWDAWSQLNDMTKETAKSTYIQEIEKLSNEIGLTSQASSSPSSKSENTKGSDEPIIVTNQNGVYEIKINRPSKRNAITTQMYDDIADNLKAAGQDKSVSIAVITGSGDFYSSGNDLNNFNVMNSNQDIVELAKSSAKLLANFVNAFIDFPKPLIALVNGPSVGIMCTTLALCDTVICSDKATFTTPFSQLAQSPEGCSSYTFPIIMGSAKANQMLMFNHKMNATEAEACGFVARVVPFAEFESYTNEWLHGPNGLISTCIPSSLFKTKKLLRSEQAIQHLRNLNKTECDVLLSCWLSPEFPGAIAKFFSRKKIAASIMMCDLNSECLRFLKLHDHTQYTNQCCQLLNEEWPRSEAARLHSLEQSRDSFPCSFVLVDPNDKVLGHVKLKCEPIKPDSVFLESLIVKKEFRGKGFGKFIMEKIEEISKNWGFKKIILTTMDKFNFYNHLGYEIVNPIQTQQKNISFVTNNKGITPPFLIDKQYKILMHKML